MSKKLDGGKHYRGDYLPRVFYWFAYAIATRRRRTGGPAAATHDAAVRVLELVPAGGDAKRVVQQHYGIPLLSTIALEPNFRTLLVRPRSCINPNTWGRGALY